MKHKLGGVYSDIVGIFEKRGGVYAPTEGVFAKHNGTYETIAAGGGAGLLDAYLANLWGAYSINKLVGAYAGAAIRVRRSSDNTEQDIGFSAGMLDSAALLAFAGAGSAYVKILYDQSGNGRDFNQPTAARQARIVDAGIYSGVLYFDGTDDGMQTAVTTGAGKECFCVFMTGAYRVVNPRTNAIILEHTADGLVDAGMAIYNDSANIMRVGSSGQSNDFAADITNTCWTYQINRVASGVTAGNRIRAWKAGVEIDAGAGSGATGAFADAKWNLCRRNDSSLSSPTNVQTVLIYDADTAANVAAIAGAIAYL